MTFNRRHILAGMAAGLAIPASAQQTTSWKAVANHRNGAGWSHRWPWLIEEVQKRTNGKLVLNVTSVPELGFSGQELLRALRSNLVDLSDVVAGYVGGDFPALDAPQLPGVYKDYDTTKKAVDVWLENIVAPAEQIMGGKTISSFNWNSVFLFSKTPINSLADIKGMKIRTFSPGLVDYIGALGGEPVSMPVGDLYTGLERGTIQGAVTGPDQVEGQRLYEVCKYMTDLQLGSSPSYTVVSRRSWDRLPADIKSTLEALGKEYTVRGWDAGRINDKSGIDVAKAKGMTVADMKPEWQPELQRIAKEVVVAKWSKRVGDKVTQQFNQFLGPIAGFTV